MVARGRFKYMVEMPDGNQEGASTLRVYVAQHCPVCREALGLVEGIRQRFSQLDIQVIDLDTEHTENLDGVFCVPAYVLDGRTLSLGNPEAEVLEQKLMGAMSMAGKERE